MSGPPASAPDRTLLAAYARRTPDADAWDEMVGSQAGLRPAWRDPRWRSYSGAGSASDRTSVTSPSAACDPPASRLGADAHAWALVLGPQAGWVDVDPTNNQFVDDRFVVLTYGRDYDDVPALKGVVLSDASHSTMRVRVDVTRV